MLLRFITLLSLALSAAVCGFTGAFESLGWLWKLPLAFGGFWIVQCLGAFFFLWAICHGIDLSEPQEQDDPFYRKVTTVYCQAILSILRMRLHITGMEQLPTQGRFLLVCNHLHILDPVLLLACFPKSQLAFISKRENDNMFIIGKLMHKLLCQPINRENDREALRTILRCISILKEDKASIMVFPEGYTSLDGKLHHFRSGAFKIAQKANVPIVVCAIQNTQHVFHNFLRLRSTPVELHLAGVIPPEALKGVTTVEIGQQVHTMMAQALGPDLVAQDAPAQTSSEE